jgi:hypothetical protein
MPRFGTAPPQDTRQAPVFHSSNNNEASSKPVAQHYRKESSLVQHEDSNKEHVRVLVHAAIDQSNVPLTIAN